MAVALLKQRMEDHESRHDEFMKRTDASLTQMRDTLTVLSRESGEWAGVRKTLSAIAVVLTLAGALVGYVAHYLWSPGTPVN
jgi:hypothetical protein